MAHRKEQGNVLGFVLVGVLLAALVVGGIFVARNMIAKDSQTPTDTQVASNDKQKTTDDKKSTNTTTPSENKDTNNDLQAALKAQADAEKKAKDQQAANSQTQQQNTQSTTTTTPQSQTQTTTNTTTTQTTTSAHLPQTGPEDAIVPMVGAMTLVGAVMAYRRSQAAL